MKKFLMLLLCVLLVGGTLVGCDKLVDTKKTRVNGTVTQSKKTTESYSDSTTKRVNGKSKTTHTTKYRDIYVVKVKYTCADGKEYTDKLTLRYDTQRSKINNYYKDFEEGDNIPIIVTEKIYEKDKTAENYSTYSIDIDRDYIEQ